MIRLRAALLLAALAFPRLARAEPEAPVCKDCRLILPPGEARGPRPLLVALHGDGGGVGKIVRAFEKASAEAGVILFAPRCPIEKKCPAGSWWQWLAGPDHDPAWLGAQIEEVMRRHAIDPAHVHATGFSGGATYLGRFAPIEPRRFASIAFVSGGAPYPLSCPSCKLPVLFLIGGVDPMLGPYTGPLRRWFEDCGGHEIAWQQLPGVGHEQMLQVLEAGRAKAVIDWLLERPAACAEPVSESEADAGSPMNQPRSEPPAVILAPAPQPPAMPPGPRGCSCDLSAEGGAGPALLAAILAAMAGSCRSRRR
jgi:predicted esterase